MKVQLAPSVESRRHWFHLVRLGCYDARISPHNPKVADSNPAPATMNDEGLADATAANPFRLPRLHPGIDSAAGDAASRTAAQKPKRLGEGRTVPSIILSPA